jgi:small subunit ribosomal protein S4
MGDPRRPRRRYSRPTHPWRIERLTEENDLVKKYGLKNKREIWRAKTALSGYRGQARALLGSSGEFVEKNKKELLDKLNTLGITDSRSLDDVLALTVEHILDRRLQTIVVKKGLARTTKQARQLVVHGHVIVGENAIAVPKYLVPKSEEDLIRISEKIIEKIKVINVGEGRDQAKEAPKEAG